MKAPQRPGAPRPFRPGARPTPKAGVPRAHAAPRSAPPVIKPSAASSMSWRAVVLTGVLALALAVMVPSARAYLKQQETLADLEGQVAAAQAQVDELQGQAARWNDPAYVVAQARDRLVYVLPGETPYRVVDPDFVGVPVTDAPTPPDAEAPPVRPWFATLWSSVATAGIAP